MSDSNVDVLIVGAGASAAAFAWSIADTKMHVLCLEQGDWVDYSKLPATGRDWESRTDFSADPGVRQNEADYPVDCGDSEINVANFNGVGGGTILYAAHFPRLHPSDFKTRTLDQVGEDWPVDYETLEKYYDINDRIMGVAGLAGDPAYPERQPPPMPPIALGKSGETLAKGYNNLGWHWWPTDCAINTEARDGRAKCINLGACTRGCAQGAKASVDVTYWPLAIRAGVELRTRCRVKEVTLGTDGFVNGVIYYDDKGVERFQGANLVVIACNGIGTPRTLLNSRSDRFPNGLANSSGLVGKNLMFHPYVAVEAEFEHELDGNRGPVKGISSHEFYETDVDRGFKRGFSIEMHRGFGPVTSAINGMVRGHISWGERHHADYRKLLDRTMAISAVCEDLPELHNEVVLDMRNRDSDGLPGVKINYKLGENSQRMVNYALPRLRDVMLSAGAKRILAEHVPLKNAGWHNLGTARWGDNPENSVVNGWGRTHDVNNLFIIDGSLFPTSAAVNPTATIQAVALYVADEIKKRLAEASLFD